MDDKPGKTEKIGNLEKMVYDCQVKVHSQQMRILDEEERLAKSQLIAITRQIKGIDV